MMIATMQQKDTGTVIPIILLSKTCLFFVFSRSKVETNSVHGMNLWQTAMVMESNVTTLSLSLSLKQTRP
jgi:hypothetical protein